MAGRSRATRTRTYAASGVNRSKVTKALGELLRAARYTAPASHGRPLDAPGHYAGIVRVGRETLAVTTDTVGTKVLLAEKLGRWEEVGEDTVAINVNDLASVGARPVGIVDTILCAQPDAATFRAIGRGLARGLTAARCSLLGGETAVVGEIVRGIDLGATAFGVFPDGRAPVLGKRIRPGDAIVGIPSTGIHANGFTLVRRLLDESRVDLRRPRPGARLAVGRELLTPTRTYSEFADALAELPGIHGLAHISGGGVRNLPRLNQHVRFNLDSWPAPPPLFGWLQELGGLSDREMFETFNAGIGFVIVVAGSQVGSIRRRLARVGARDSVVIGHVEKGRGVVVPSRALRYEGYS
ncbi:MAG TPA: phosphoribosylformylglycinamidine cyclo-ligase [Thermoplasmata archaeon]|nr:phosphoribosylformylglycinamidine cyclo-ligase [Thermoplasmata archaeon]